eukprot:Skav231212  [mRNA]  locus=scaffold2958:165351:176447:- [translate_table: standard]
MLGGCPRGGWAASQRFSRLAGATYDLDVFDLEFWRERLVEDRLGLKEEYIRQFFPLDAVLEGLFHLLGELFDVAVRQEPSELCWAKDVQFYRMVNRSTGDPVTHAAPPEPPCCYDQDRELCSLPFDDHTAAGAFFGELWAQALALDIFSEFQGQDRCQGPWCGGVGGLEVGNATR